MKKIIIALDFIQSILYWPLFYPSGDAEKSQVSNGVTLA